MSQKMSLATPLRLNSGYSIPRLGFGVYKIPAEETAAAVKEAVRQGFRHFDSATAYNNQAHTAAGIRESGVDRSEIFFTTKIPKKGKPLGYQNTIDHVDTALSETGFAYLDLVLIHWPYGGPEARKETWRALVECVQTGRVRSIGVCNYGIHHLNELESFMKQMESEHGAGAAGVLSVGQWEVHPWLTRPEITKWCRDRNIAVEAYGAIVRGQRPGEPKVAALAKKYGKTEAQILLRWSLQMGFVPLVKSVTPSRIAENVDIDGFELTEVEVEDLMTDEYSPCAWDPSTEPLDK